MAAGERVLRKAGQKSFVGFGQKGGTVAETGNGGLWGKGMSSAGKVLSLGHV